MMHSSIEVGLVAYVAMTIRRRMEPDATNSDIANNFDAYKAHGQAVIDALRPILDDYERLAVKHAAAGENPVD